jgi:hypothetical protein
MAVLRFVETLKISCDMVSTVLLILVFKSPITLSVTVFIDVLSSSTYLFI